MSNQKDCVVRITAHQQAELQTVERDSKPLAPDELVGRSIVTLISAGTELASAYQATSGFPRGVGYAAVFEVEAVGEEGLRTLDLISAYKQAYQCGGVVSLNGCEIE